MWLALDLFLKITLRRNNLRDGRRKFKTKTALTLNLIWNSSVAKHCPPTEGISPAMLTTQSEPLDLIWLITWGGMFFLQVTASFLQKSTPFPWHTRCQNLTVLTPSNAAGEFTATGPPTQKNSLITKMNRSRVIIWAASPKRKVATPAGLEQTLRQADNLKPRGPGWKGVADDISCLLKGQTRKANTGSFCSLFFTHQHQERNVAALLEKRKEMDSGQERNGSYLQKIANLCCLQTSPLRTQRWEGGRGVVSAIKNTTWESISFP